MDNGKDIVVIIPAFNEELSIGMVLDEIPRKLVSEIVVVDNNSTDSTAARAAEKGATVLSETFQGYGAACLKGMAYVMDRSKPPDLIVFMDADHSDYPAELEDVIRPILEEGMDMVIGSRALGVREKGSMMPQQIFGNWLATTLIRWFYGVRFSDLGPFRAITATALTSLGMQDKTYGWTVEMQVKAARKGLKISEIAVNYRKRKGVSKIAGTLKGTVLAGYKIISTIFRYS